MVPTTPTQLNNNYSSETSQMNASMSTSSSGMGSAHASTPHKNINIHGHQNPAGHKGVTTTPNIKHEPNDTKKTLTPSTSKMADSSASTSALKYIENFSNPYVKIIGHPTGRLVGRRKGADIHMTDLLKAAADNGVMMEINAHPKRLDLDEINAAAARDLGIPIVISTDSHSVNGFDVLQYGVDQARRAGLSKDDVANTKTWAQFGKLLK